MSTNANSPVFTEPTAVERVFNRVFGWLVGFRPGYEHSYLLQVRGARERETVLHAGLSPGDGRQVSGGAAWVHAVGAQRQLPEKSR